MFFRFLKNGDSFIEGLLILSSAYPLVFKGQPMTLICHYGEGGIDQHPGLEHPLTVLTHDFQYVILQP